MSDFRSLAGIRVREHAIYEVGRVRGAAEERAAIVAWLEDAKRGDLSGLYLASFIARGDHLRSDNE